MDVDVLADPTSTEVDLVVAFLNRLEFNPRWVSEPADVHLVVRRGDDGLQGCGAATVAGRTAVLMSFAVEPSLRSQGIGSALARAMLAHLEHAGVRRVFLLSRSSGGFWMRHGFGRIPVARIVAEAAAHYQVAVLIEDGSINTDVPYELAFKPAA